MKPPTPEQTARAAELAPVLAFMEAAAEIINDQKD